MTQSTINIKTLREMLEHGEPVTVLDIRRTDDWAEWAIPGSLNIDAYDALKAGDPDALAAVSLPVDRPVVTVCGAGVVSQIAADQLRARGFETRSLEGGMKAWSLAWNSAELTLPDSNTRLIQVRRTGKGCLSYLIGSEGIAAVIDPALDPEVYLGLARSQGWTIRYVLDTHIHADHLSRGRMLAEQAGATFYLPAQERVAYPFQPLQEGQTLLIGAAKLVALHTPGHTLESMGYLLDNQALFSGDTLFLAAVGRPDLEASPDEARSRAHLLYHSLKRLLNLSRDTLILPGHTSQAVAFDGQPVVASLAEVFEQVQFLRLPEEVFVESLLARIPPTPPNHQRIVELNEVGLLPEGDPVELEAGANRCAIA